MRSEERKTTIKGTPLRMNLPDASFDEVPL